MSEPKTFKRGSVALLADLMAHKASEYTVAEIQTLLRWFKAEWLDEDDVEAIERWAKEAGIPLDETRP
jgi:hypothetical protein